MDSVLMQLGVGGIFAILIIREVLNFAKASKVRESANGNKPVTRSEFEKHKDAVQYRDNCVQIVKRIDSAFASAEKRADERLRGVDTQFEAVGRQIGEVKTMIQGLSR